MTALAAAIGRKQYELAALRLVLGVTAALDRASAGAIETREELLTLLSRDRP